ncbi:MAG: hypothetical protein HGA65_09715 [Oscillochloris sp.]|nr:hypothetical protein [Oscillochloris sp.]
MGNVWEPTQTWAFVVGLLEWQRDDIYTAFPQTQRRDAQLVKLLAERGVPKGQICYLQDRQATTAAITARMAEHLEAAPAGSTLILYYCGHGGMGDHDQVFFASYDADDSDNPGWPVSAIPDAVEAHFPGSQAILLADCCHSGRLADAVAARKRRVAYASLGSSLASELSTGNWTFTEALLAALRGDAYTDRDGSATITLAELAEHIQAELAFAEEQVATFATSSGFDARLVLGPAKPRRDPQIGRQVVVKSDDAWYAAQVIDVRKGELKLRYYGYDSSDDTWVSADEVRTIGRPHYPVGATVEVQWKNRWYLASVLDERAGVHQIAYEGYGPEFNEWVSSKRIRPLL